MEGGTNKALCNKCWTQKMNKNYKEEKDEKRESEGLKGFSN